MIERITLVLYLLWRALLVTLAFLGWLIGTIIGTFAGGVWSGLKRGFTG